MDLSDVVRQQLRTLWLEVGGRYEDVREFWQEARRRGIRVKYPDVTFFLRTLPLPNEVRDRLDVL